jgi:hypothetical protein
MADLQTLAADIAEAHASQERDWAAYVEHSELSWQHLNLKQKHEERLRQLLLQAQMAVKAALGHGHWLKWLRENVPTLPIRTAQHHLWHAKHPEGIARANAQKLALLNRKPKKRKAPEFYRCPNCDHFWHGDSYRGELISYSMHHPDAVMNRADMTNIVGSYIEHQYKKQQKEAAELESVATFFDELSDAEMQQEEAAFFAELPDDERQQIDDDLKADIAYAEEELARVEAEFAAAEPAGADGWLPRRTGELRDRRDYWKCGLEVLRGRVAGAEAKAA